MNEHEIERIADAIHRLRPDWPTKQLTTLLRDDRMADRPRRDVTVALAWVACESGTSTPYRVLEAGPWWRAAAIEGATTRREVLAPEERCSVCSQSRSKCEDRPRFGADDAIDDHAFSPDFRSGTDPDTTARIAEALRGELQPMREPQRRQESKR